MYVGPNLNADQTNSATNRRARMEYLATFIAPIVRQRSAHQCFVLSRVWCNENIVRLSSDSDDLKKKKTRHSVSLEFCCDRKLLSFFYGLREELGKITS